MIISEAKRWDTAEVLKEELSKRGVSCKILPDRVVKVDSRDSIYKLDTAKRLRDKIDKTIEIIPWR